MTGIGTYKYADGSKYTGGWKQNQKNGHGREEYPDNSYFDGMY